MSVPPDGTTPEQLIADLQRQLAERTAERDEALARETATVEVLAVINSSPGNLTPVFESLLEKAHAFCGAAYGTLQLYDGTTFCAVAVHGLPEALAIRLREGSVPGPNMRRLIDDGADFGHIPDMAERVVDSPMARAVVDAGIRTLLWVPLRKDGKLLGLISAGRQEVRPFSDKEIALLQNFAAQAVIAMENARLLGELRQRTDDLTESLEYQTATSELLEVISRSTYAVQPVLDTMLASAARLCASDVGAVAIRQGTVFRYVATMSMSAENDKMNRAHIYGIDRSTAIGRVALSRAVVHIPDAQADSEYSSPSTNAMGTRTILGVPLLREGEVIGVIVQVHYTVKPFSERQIALVRTFADQAVIAMENARLLTEQREALERQTATAEVLQVINSSPGNLAPVFDAMLEKAMRLCEASFGSLWTLDGDRFRPVANRGLPARYAEYLQQDVPAAGTGTGRARLLAGEAFAHIADLADDEPYRKGEPHRRALVDLGGARTALLMPLRRDDTVCGFIMIYRQEVRPFSDKQIALLQTFAAQAVIAMENARLLGELRERTDQVAELNRGLEARVAEQVEELGRVGRLKRFLAPQLAELIVSQGDEKILESHRREIVVVFCDLRGYTAFAETAEPEEVLDFLREYHGALGPLVSQFEGTLDQFSGDGIMVFFNDPVPIPDSAERAVRMAAAMRDAASTLIATWRERGRQLGFGVGIAQGYATLGQIGFSERSGYTAIGTVCNVAARLCGEAKDGQILLSQRVNVALKGSVATEQVGALVLKGLTQPVVAYNVPLAASQPALRVIDGGSH